MPAKAAQQIGENGFFVTRAIDHPQFRTEVSERVRWKEMADLPSAQSRAEFLDGHPELAQPDVVAYLTALVPQLVKSDRNRALSVAEVAVMIANRLGDAHSVAQSLRAKANAHYGLGQNKTALEHHRKALRLFRTLGDYEQVARTLSSSIQPLILQGRYRQALVAAREAREVFTKQGNRWRLARLDLNLGNILDRQDRFAESLECYERAYQYLSLHEQDDPEGVGVALHNMAVSHVRQNQFRKAEAIYENARSFAAAHDMPVLVGQSDYNIAWLYFLRGDYSRATSMLRAARETCLSAGDEHHVALCHLDLSEIYLELNLTAEATEAAEQASAGFEQLGMRYERAKSIANLAVAMSRQGHAIRSLELFLQARQIFLKEKNEVLPSVIDLYRAAVLFGQRRDAKARKLCVAALSVFRRFNFTHKAIECLLLTASLHLRENDLRSAQQQCTRALRSLIPLELPALSCQAFALRGQIHAAAGHDRRSYEAYQRAREYLDRLRNSIRGEELRISFMKGRVEIYEALVALRMKRTDSTKVVGETFGYVQQAKSRTLLDFIAVSRSPSSPAAQLQPERDKKIEELREELNWFFRITEMAQLKQASQRQLSALRAEAHRRERELLKLSREHAPTDDFGDERQLAVTFTIQQVRESLRADVTILEYFQAQGQIIVILLSRSQLQVIPLGELSQISALLELLQLQLSKPRLDLEYVRCFAGGMLNATQAHLQELYKLLIGPIRGALGGSHLVIAPHGILHSLPFHALFDGIRYLIDEFTVSYAPSASVYALCQARSTCARAGSLVFGVPDPTVPFVKAEVEAVAACLPNPEVFLADSATADCLRQKGPHSRFIHIATHGYFRRDNPMFSGVRLGDSYLSLYDLYQLKLPAELVALSGCSTGMNIVAAGDELLGLVRGLIRSGAETSMLTLWDVHDESTTQLMKTFYHHLSGGSSKTVAIQQAMRLVKSEHPHPYYWAPFILVGKA
jgi:CHAT domain-containing protein